MQITQRQPYITPYEFRPEQTSANKIIFLTGPSGSGKSTLGNKLKESGNHIFYEGDCFLFHLNPYTDTVPNAAGGGTPLLPERLIGIPTSTIQNNKQALDGYLKITQGKEVSFTVWEKFYQDLCNDILLERERHGKGWNFVVANAIYTRQARDLVQKLLGSAAVFVVLDIDVQQQSERIASRFGMPSSAAKSMEKYCRGFETGDAKEINDPNILSLQVGTKTPDELLAEIVSFVNAGTATAMDMDMDMEMKTNLSSDVVQRRPEECGKCKKDMVQARAYFLSLGFDLPSSTEASCDVCGKEGTLGELYKDGAWYCEKGCDWGVGVCCI